MNALVAFIGIVLYAASFIGVLEYLKKRYVDRDELPKFLEVMLIMFSFIVIAFISAIIYKVIFPW